jgi:hypothetical protein
MLRPANQPYDVGIQVARSFVLVMLEEQHRYIRSRYRSLPRPSAGSDRPVLEHEIDGTRLLFDQSLPETYQQLSPLYKQY